MVEPFFIVKYSNANVLGVLAMSVNLDRLDERVNGIVQSISEIKEHQKEMGEQQKQISEDVRTIAAALDKVNILEVSMQENTAAIIKHQLAWKIFTTVLLACVGLIGFAYKEMQSFKQADAELKERIAYLEYVTNGKSKIDR